MKRLDLDTASFERKEFQKGCRQHQSETEGRLFRATAIDGNELKEWDGLEAWVDSFNEFFKKAKISKEILNFDDPYCFESLRLRIFSKEKIIKTRPIVSISGSHDKRRTFEGRVFFEGFCFYKVVFRNCDFCASATFSSAEFLDEVVFEGCTFSGAFPASFSQAIFKKGVVFKSCRFDDPPNFEAAVFRAQDAGYSSILFDEKCEFSDFQDAESEKNYRVLIEHLSAAKSEKAAFEFGVRELKIRTRLMSWKKEPANKAFLKFYGYASEFSSSTGRPILLNFLTLVVIWGLAFSSGVGVNQSTPHYWLMNSENYTLSVFYALEVVSGPVRLLSSSGVEPCSPSLKLVSLAATIFCSANWFFLLNAIRRNCRIDGFR